MTLANTSGGALDGWRDDRVGRVEGPVDAPWPHPLARATDWAKARRRRRYLAAVKRRLRRYHPPPGP